MCAPSPERGVHSWRGGRAQHKHEHQEATPPRIGRKARATVCRTVGGKPNIADPKDAQVETTFSVQLKPNKTQHDRVPRQSYTHAPKRPWYRVKTTYTRRCAQMRTSKREQHTMRQRGRTTGRQANMNTPQTSTHSAKQRTLALNTHTFTLPTALSSSSVHRHCPHHQRLA